MLSRPTAAVIRRLSETGFEDRHFECLPRSDNVAELSRFGGQLAHHYPEPALREQPASRAVVGTFDDALCRLRSLLVRQSGGGFFFFLLFLVPFVCSVTPLDCHLW